MTKFTFTINGQSLMVTIIAFHSEFEDKSVIS